MKTAGGIVAVLFLTFAGIAGAFPEDRDELACVPDEVRGRMRRRE